MVQVKCKLITHFLFVDTTCCVWQKSAILCYYTELYSHIQHARNALKLCWLIQLAVSLLTWISQIQQRKRWQWDDTAESLRTDLSLLCWTRKSRKACSNKQHVQQVFNVQSTHNNIIIHHVNTAQEKAVRCFPICYAANVVTVLFIQAKKLISD